MLRSVDLVRTDVSEELSSSFVRVTRIGELGTTLAVTSNRRTQGSHTRATRRNITEDATLQVPSSLRSHSGCSEELVYFSFSLTSSPVRLLLCLCYQFVSESSLISIANFVLVLIFVHCRV
jgi:hypothetical protein